MKQQLSIIRNKRNKSKYNHCKLKISIILDKNVHTEISIKESNEIIETNIKKTISKKNKCLMKLNKFSKQQIWV